jgi:polyphosphate kinase
MADEGNNLNTTKSAETGVGDFSTMSAPSAAHGASHPLPSELYLNRELSWIRFNERVLAQALDPATPLLEQAKFSAIFSNNLDEFFMVRVASLQSQHHAQRGQARSHDGRTPLEQLDEIRRRAANRCWSASSSTTARALKRQLS